MKYRKTIILTLTLLLLTSLCCTSALAAGGDVAGAVEQTWTEAAKQIKSVVEKVVFPALDMILAIAFFVKLGGAYFDYRQRGQFEWTGPAILFACLIFTLTAPKYILEHHRNLSQEERTIKSRIRTLLPDITDEAMVAWIVYVDEVGRHGCFTKIPLR